MLEHGVPYGHIIKSDNYKCGKPGIYRCRVKAPDNLQIPILPARNTKGAMRWYSGEFETVCTNIELIFAARHGYKILEIYEGIIFDDTIFPFRNHINHCKEIREKYKRGVGEDISPEEYLAKFMQNSLYGKFGSRRERRRLISSREYEKMSHEKRIDIVPYDDCGKWYVVKELDENMRTLPQWAVFITAQARLKLLETAYTIGVENVYYGDTDSLTIKKGYEKKLPIGNDYGQWKVEKQWKNFRAIAPKVYAGELMGGDMKGAAKGLPRRNLNKSNWESLLENGNTEASALSLDSLRVSLKNGVRPARELLRKSSDLEKSINFVDIKGKVYVKMQA